MRWQEEGRGSATGKVRLGFCDKVCTVLCLKDKCVAEAPPGVAPQVRCGVQRCQRGLCSGAQHTLRDNGWCRGRRQQGGGSTLGLYRKQLGRAYGLLFDT